MSACGPEAHVRFRPIADVLYPSRAVVPSGNINSFVPCLRPGGAALDLEQSSCQRHGLPGGTTLGLAEALP
jgi:hypothetical protein